MIQWLKQLRIAFGASFLWLVCLIYFTQVFVSYTSIFPISPDSVVAYIFTIDSLMINFELLRVLLVIVLFIKRWSDMVFVWG